MKTRSLALTVCMSLFVAGPAFSQHDHGSAPADTTARHTSSMSPADHMTTSIYAGAPANRVGSGTAWLPDFSPMHALHYTPGSWSLMLHGSLFARYGAQDIGNAGSRGDEQFNLPGWTMLMASPPAGDRWRFMARVMLSIDRITTGGDGYPLLFQSGETWEDEPLVDRQHPHDLFTELALFSAFLPSPNAELYAYFGFPGEPAIGPPAFMHRPSAKSNPDATLGHHWQDATHITFGVLTGGFQYRYLKIESSLFTGREPDEDRFDFDKPRFDSYSFRLSANFLSQFAAQISWGFLKSPEQLEPDTDQRRTAASILYHAPMGDHRYLAAAAIWGLLDATTFEPQHSWVFEAELEFGRGSVYSRVEAVEKNGHELDLEELEHDKFTVGAFTLGGTRALTRISDLDLRIGGHVTANAVPDLLQPLYGENPLSIEVFLQLLPTDMMSKGYAPAPRH